MLIQPDWPTYCTCPGVWVQRWRIPDRRAWGCSAEIDLGAVEAILGGGSGDTQQSITGCAAYAGATPNI